MFVIDKLLWYEEAPLCVKCGLEILPSDYLLLREKNISKKLVDLYFHKECKPTEQELLKYLGFKNKGK